MDDCNKRFHIDTRCIHTESTLIKEHSFGALSVPIYQTATFAHPGVDESTGYDYSRESNPTRSELERVITSLEGVYDSIATSTGMAAISLCFSLLKPGSHVIATRDLYGGSVRLFQKYELQMGLRFSYVDTSDEEAIRKEIRPETKAIFIETPSNPTMRVTDLSLIGSIAKEHDILYIVDNTFLTPYYQNPVDFGADIIIHSGTKFLSGHNDTLAGFVCAANKEIAKKLRFDYKTTGASLAPFDSFLVLRGLKTLPVRLQRQQENALLLANKLITHPRIKEVYYIGLKDHPGFEVNKKQSRGTGSMISFKTDSADTAIRVLSEVKLVSYAESLGGVESLITYPMKQTHGDVPLEIRQELGITDDFLRLSVGVENIDDITEDIFNALG